MSAHPTEVVTLFIQDAVTPADTAKVFDRAGLTRYAYHPDGIAAPWPTLRAMVESGRRLVVLMENQGGGDAHGRNCRIGPGDHRDGRDCVADEQRHDPMARRRLSLESD